MKRLGAVVAFALAIGSHPAQGALPPFHGGTVRVPSPSPVYSLDPTEVSTPFEATVSAAVFEPLYRVESGGRVVPLLAAGPPEREGETVRIPLRTGVVRHGGATLTAGAVAASLRRASNTPRARWLLAGFVYERGRLKVDRGDDHVTLTLEATDVGGVARRLAAAPLAIVVGNSPRRRPVGTGPFSARFVDGKLQLRAFRLASSGGPRLAEVLVQTTAPRDETLRAFERGELDFSWWGSSVYGGRPPGDVARVEGPAAAPVLLVPNRRRGPLANNGSWGRLARAVERGRLRRAGLQPAATLAPGLPSPSAPAASGSQRITVQLLVRGGDAFEERLAEALAGPLDEHGFSVRVDRVPPERYTAAVSSGRYDLSFVTVLPPLPGAGPLVGAALAATGRVAEADAMMRRGGLEDRGEATAAARRLDAIVLGRRQDELSYRADLRDVGFDELGRLDLASISISRSSIREAP